MGSWMKVQEGRDGGDVKNVYEDIEIKEEELDPDRGRARLMEHSRKPTSIAEAPARELGNNSAVLVRGV